MKLFIDKVNVAFLNPKKVGFYIATHPVNAAQYNVHCYINLTKYEEDCHDYVLFSTTEENTLDSNTEYKASFVRECYFLNYKLDYLREEGKTILIPHWAELEKFKKVTEEVLKTEPLWFNKK